MISARQQFLFVFVEAQLAAAVVAVEVLIDRLIAFGKQSEAAAAAVERRGSRGGSRRKALIATIKKLAAATRPIVSVLRTGWRAPLRTASRASGPPGSIRPRRDRTQLVPNKRQRGDQHQKPGAEKDAGLLFAASATARRGADGQAIVATSRRSAPSSPAAA